MIFQCIKDAIGKQLATKYIHNPIFVVGSGRSGTSILLQALGAHDDILAFPGEAPFLTSIGGNARLLSADNSDYYLSSLKITPAYFFNSLAKLAIESAGGENYALKLSVKNLLKTKRRPNNWATKTFPTQNVYFGLLNVFPNAKFIYIFRNGIDVVHSMSKYHGFKDFGFEERCKAWSDSIKKYQFLLNYSNALCLRHEDLVLNPDNFFSLVFDFLKIEHQSECVYFASNTLIHSLDKPDQKKSQILDHFKTRESPFVQWTNSQKRIFIDLCSESMELMNYRIE